VAALVASRMAFDAYGSTDLAAIGLFSGGVVVAYALGGFSNFLLRRPFASDAVFAVLVMVTLAAFVIFQFTHQAASMNEPARVDWRLVPAAVLILFALWILAALALACSTRLDMIPTLAICSALFLLGLVSDYIYFKLGGTLEGGPWWATALYTVLPNWQNFWLADVLTTGKGAFHWGYVGKALVYVIGYAGAALSAAVLLFEERELS
jgi:hypothetical protein